MGWSELPVSEGSLVTAAQMGELRSAIIERRRAVNFAAAAGLGDPPVVSAGSLATAATLNAYRARLEEIIPHYIDTNETGYGWTKAGVISEAFGQGRTEWTRVPARAGETSYAAELVAGDVMYVEHINELKDVIDLLYLVPLKEFDGREYAADDSNGWTWSDVDGDLDNACTAHGNHQTGSYSETAESAPFDFIRHPIDPVTVVEVKAKGALRGADEDATVKFINFVNGDAGDDPPSDRDWYAELRISDDRPAGSPRGLDTEIACYNNLADDGSHTADSKNDSDQLLEVYVSDQWGPEILSHVPDEADWPFWLTFVVADHTDVIAAYAQEAAASGRELQIWWAKAQYSVTRIWAKLNFQYK